MMDYKKSIDVFNAMIDDHCDLYGVHATIAYLMDLGCTHNDLIDLLFDETDIKIVEEERNKKS